MTLFRSFEGAAIGRHDERRGLLVVKGTQAFVVAAGGLQAHEASDEIDEIDPVSNLLDDFVRDASQSLGPRPWLGPLLRRPALLLERAFAGCSSLLLLADARLVVVLAALELAENSRLFALLFEADRKSTRLNSSHTDISRMPSSA